MYKDCLPLHIDIPTIVSVRTFKPVVSVSIPIIPSSGGSSKNLSNILPFSFKTHMLAFLYLPNFSSTNFLAAKMRVSNVSPFFYLKLLLGGSTFVVTFLSI